MTADQKLEQDNGELDWLGVQKDQEDWVPAMKLVPSLNVLHWYTLNTIFEVCTHFVASASFKVVTIFEVTIFEILSRFFGN